FRFKLRSFPDRTGTVPTGQTGDSHQHHAARSDTTSTGVHVRLRILVTVPGLRWLPSPKSHTWQFGVVPRSEVQMGIQCDNLARKLMRILLGCVTVLAGIVELLAQGGNPDAYYRLGPDSVSQEGVPRGEVRGPFTLPSEAYPGTQHTYWVYVPAQYDPAVP